MNDETGHNTIKEVRSQRLTFLLRLWCEDQTGCSNWRASLELPGNGKRIGFASLEELFIYLIDLAESRSDFRENKSKETARKEE